MKKVVLALVMMVSLVSCKKHYAWTREYEAKTYKEVYTTIAVIFKDSTQRKQIAQYMIKRYKVLLPYGIESIPGDSLKQISAKIGREYVKLYKTDNLQAVLQWNAETEASLRNSLLNQKALKSFDIKSRNNFCNCFLANLKKVYPDSIVTPIPDSIYTRVVNTCLYTIKKK